MPRRPAAAVAEPSSAESSDESPVKTAAKQPASRKRASSAGAAAPAAKRRSLASSAAAKALPGTPGGPLYADGANDVCGYWNGKWYPITILSGGLAKKGGKWLYEIRWDGFTNSAKAGEAPTNESTYPENWIWTKAEVKAEEDYARSLEAAKAKPAPAKPKNVAKKSTQRPATAATPVVAATRKATKPSATPAAVPTAEALPADPGVRWQYFDNKKGGGDRGWHNYDMPASKKVEEAYQSWASDPAIDVRAVKSGQWNYMVDFNTMQQTNIDHEAHTVRKIRRMDASGQKPMMEEAKEIQRRVKLTRQKSQSDQLARTGSVSEPTPASPAAASPAPPAASPGAPRMSQRLASRSASQGSAATGGATPLARSASQASAGHSPSQPTGRSAALQAATGRAAAAAAAAGEWRGVSNLAELTPGMTVRVKDTPASSYPYERTEQFGKEATILTITGYPPVHLRFADGSCYWYMESDLEIRKSAEQ